jgi:hypothetical protein
MGKILIYLLVLFVAPLGGALGIFLSTPFLERGRFLYLRSSDSPPSPFFTGLILGFFYSMTEMFLAVKIFSWFSLPPSILLFVLLTAQCVLFAIQRYSKKANNRDMYSASVASQMPWGILAGSVLSGFLWFW